MIIGIDNGTTGSITAIHDNGVLLFTEKTPIKSRLKWTKQVKHMNVIEMNAMLKLFKIAKKANEDPKIICYVERPMVNSLRFNASLSAVAAYVLTVEILEMAKVPYEFVDSKTWQKGMLPAGVKGSAALKKIASEVAIRLFPGYKFPKVVADSILIAEYYRRELK